MKTALENVHDWNFEINYNTVTAVVEFSIHFVSTEQYPLLEYLLTNGTKSLLLLPDDWKLYEEHLSDNEYRYYLGGCIRAFDIDTLIEILSSNFPCIYSRLKKNSIDALLHHDQQAIHGPARIIGEPDRYRFLNCILNAKKQLKSS
ncbi:MAG: hypothetical protein WCR91_03185 [Sphaerochaetaceae bacterium]|jgi:hypothetical protein|nr:hypothetical protein [Sphaerochaetaceae bacterium]MDX9810281.1 hypothetical protein [Sphaerochaetaceae bacterium]